MSSSTTGTCIEDLHWADSLSLDLIGRLMEMVESTPLLLLCVYRPEREHGCWRLATLAARKCPDRYTELRLRELFSPQSRRLVGSLLQMEHLPAAVQTFIAEKAQGNPFFVEEVVRALIDGGLIYRSGQAWQMRATGMPVAATETVQSVLLSRVDRLEPELKGVLQSAAAIGTLFRRRVLAQVIGREDDLDQVLGTLELLNSLGVTPLVVCQLLICG